MKRTIPFFIALAISAVAYSQDDVVINEFMAINDKTLQDEDGNYPDWIELHNTGVADISLNGWYLTDDINEVTKWQFPDIIIAADEYLVVFASGKDRKLEKDKLHTNFKLSSSGEFLALVKPGGTQFTTAFSPAYPEQFADLAYGNLGGSYTYLTIATPGSENSDSTYLPPPVFSVEHGHYFNAFALELTSDVDGTEIYYTTDASTPDPSAGIKYSTPIEISTTIVIRAIVRKDDGSTSTSKTQTYLFPEDIVHQPFDPPGYPDYWLSPEIGTDNWFQIPAEYGMHESVVDDSTAGPLLVDALQELPVVSVVSDIDNFFLDNTDPDSGGIYMYNGQPNGLTASLVYCLGRGWERPASVEYFNSMSGDIDFQANCGIKIHGGASRSTRKTTKYSFKLGFKSIYGPSKLKEKVFGDGAPDQYDWLILRGGFAPRYGQQIRDPWVKLTYMEMGQHAAFNQFVHLYINGLYWGLYNFSEQMDENFMRDHYGGSEEDYDVLKDYLEVEAGDTVAWVKLMTLARDSLSNPGMYQKLLGNNPDGSPNGAYEKMVDPENLIDYMLLNFYIGNTDWDHHNWLGARNRVDPEGFRFFTWDNEYVLGGTTENVVSENNENRPSGIFRDLWKKDEFKNLFYARVNKHFFEGGALTPEPGYNRYFNLRSMIDTAVICESARWNSIDYPKRDIWENSYHNFINAYFPVRTENVLKQLIAAEMYPKVDPPTFNTDLKYLPEDFQLHLNGPATGEIRYTFDDSDPGFVGGETQSEVFTYTGNALAFTDDTIVVKARVYKEGYWSSLVRKQFIIGNPDAIIPYLSNGNDFYFYSYPNPMQEYATIKYALPENSHISIRIYDVMGKLITILEEGMVEAGEYTVKWNSVDIPSGMYYCILENKTNSSNHRFKIVKR